MRKIVCVILAMSMAAMMTACAGSGSSESSATESSTASVSSTASESSASQTESSETSADATGEVMTYEEYMAAELDSQVTVETYVQAKQSWWEDKATVYAQSEDGAYFIYDMACSEEDYDLLTPGTCIRVTGYKGEWSGEVEIMDGTFEIVEGKTFVAEPVDVTEMLGKDELIDHQNQLVQFKGLTVAPSTDANGEEAAFLYNYDGSGSDGDDLYFNVSYNGETYTFTVESYLCDNTTEVYKAVTGLEVGQTIDAEGFLYWYEGVNPHITSITVAE
jgi:hypothetical protein